MKNKSLFFGIIVIIAVIFTSKIVFNNNNKIYKESSEYNNSAQSQIDDSRKTIITETAAKVSPAIVGINVTEIRQVRDPFFSPFFDDPFFRQFFGDRSTKQKVKSLGSGFIISADGYIVTNDHVAGNATEIVVTLTNGKHYNAKVIGTDQVSDICLLKIDGNNLPYLTLGNSDNVIAGEWVIALGNPFGLFEVNDKPTITVGVISSIGMNLDPVNNRYYLNMIQTDAAINGGNSGGPLVNAIGEVIGMNTLIFTGGVSQGNIGLGFAIPINKIKKTIDEFIEEGKIDRDFYTGLAVQSIDEDIAKYFNLETTRGVIITGVQPSSPAAKAGLKEGDVIIQVNDYKINNEQTLIGVLQEFRTNQTINIKIIRDNKELIKQMKLEAK